MHLKSAIYHDAKRQWDLDENTVGEYDDAPTVMRNLCESAAFNDAASRARAARA